MKYCQRCDYPHSGHLLSLKAFSHSAQACIKCGCSEFLPTSKHWRAANLATTTSGPARDDPAVLQSVAVEMLRFLIFLAALVGIGYLAYWSLLGPTHKPPDALGGQAAYSACVQFVTDSLDTPATAVFPSRFGSDTQILDLRPVYHVASYVDAQNKFGATIRTRFTCVVSWSAQQGRWSLVDLKTSPWNELR